MHLWISDLHGVRSSVTPHRQLACSIYFYGGLLSLKRHGNTLTIKKTRFLRNNVHFISTTFTVIQCNTVTNAK